MRQNPVGKSYRLARSKENLLRSRRLKIEMPTRKKPLLAQVLPKSKVRAQASEVGTRQRLSEDVSDVVMTGNTPDGEGTVLNAFTDKMMADVNMLAP